MQTEAYGDALDATLRELEQAHNRIKALEKDAARWRYVHDEPEAARHLIRLLLDGKGTPGDLDKMVDRIIASKRAAIAASEPRNGEQR